MIFTDLSPVKDSYPVILKSNNPFKMVPCNVGKSYHTRIAKEGENEYLLMKYIAEKKSNKYKLTQGAEILTKYVDFFYRAENPNISLAIELDEPYSFDRHFPIHYIDNDNDRLKEKLLLESGIHVIRFSERQIVLHVEACYLVIHHFLANILNNRGNFSLPQCVLHSDFIDKKWTANEAVAFSKWSYRENYDFQYVKEVISLGEEIKLPENDTLYELVSRRCTLSEGRWAGVPTKIFHLRKRQSDEEFYYLILKVVTAENIASGPDKTEISVHIKLSILSDKGLLIQLERNIYASDCSDSLFPIAVIFEWDRNNVGSPKKMLTREIIKLC